MRIMFHPATHKNLPGLRAEAAFVFEPEGPLSGLQLKGFSIWESKKGGAGLNVTFPSRKGSNGKEYWLLRGVDPDDQSATWKLRNIILKEYEQWRKTQV